MNLPMNDLKVFVLKPSKTKGVFVLKASLVGFRPQEGRSNSSLKKKIWCRSDDFPNGRPFLKYMKMHIMTWPISLGIEISSSWPTCFRAWFWSKGGRVTSCSACTQWDLPNSEVLTLFRDLGSTSYTSLHQRACDNAKNISKGMWQCQKYQKYSYSNKNYS